MNAPALLDLGASAYGAVPVEVLASGHQQSGYWGAFSPGVERTIRAQIARRPGPTLHLFSGRSDIGDERVDLERPEATTRADVIDFVKTDSRRWAWCLMDPPYQQKRRRKLNVYARNISLMADVQLRRAVLDYCRANVERLIWLDYAAPAPVGFVRERLWFFLPGGMHPVVVLSQLANVELTAPEVTA